MNKGVFVAFEGIDRSGKSTLLGKVANELTKRGYKVTTTHEPGGSSMGPTLRPLLLSAKSSTTTETLLFAAERSAHVAEVIKPGINSGHIVLCDRFEASTFAYQGYWRGLDLNKLKELSRFASSDVVPDLTVWCKLPPEVAAKRRESSPDELDAQAVAASEIIANGFQEIFSEYQKDKLLTIDTAKMISEEEINQVTMRIIDAYNSINEQSSRPIGKLIIIAGPSGSGKNSVVDKLLKDDPKAWFSVSITTRPPRSNEHDSVDYNFVSHEEFDKLANNGDLLEMAEYAGHKYATPRKELEEKLNSGFNVYLILELSGAKQVKDKLPEAVTIFITPPSEQVLLDRLKNRNTEDDAEIAKRISAAKIELELGPALADHVICNDNFENTIKKVKEIISL